MLFILVINVLNSMVLFTTDQGLLLPLVLQQIRCRVSCYATDAVIFLRPTSPDLLEYFGQALGLQTNISNALFS
jgi:hypothetical protein